MFIYKTDAQLEAMSAAERDTYATEKRAHEQAIQKEAIKAATEELKGELSVAQKAEIQTQIEALKLNTGITKEQFEELKEDLRVIKENPSFVSGTGNSLMDAIEVSLKEFLPKVKAAKQAAGSESPFEVEMIVKAPVNVLTTAVTSGAVPVSYVYQQVTSFATEARTQEYIINYLSNGTTAKATIPYMDKLPNEGTMAITAEGALKPLISVSFVLRYSQAKKVAGRTKISEEALDDIPYIMSIIRNELSYEHDIAIQTDIFATVAGFAPGFVAGSLAGTTKNPSNYDAIRAAIYAVKIASKGMYTPNAVLVPSSDAYAMGATKDVNNNYVMPAFVLPDGTRISGVVIVEVADGVTVPAGTFIVGDWKKLHRDVYKTFSVRIGQGIQGNATAANIVSDFESNMYTIIGESRYHLWIYENEKIAFIKSTFAAVKTAIASV